MMLHWYNAELVLYFRKPVVTRKVVDSEEEENVSLEEMDTASQPSSQANSPAPQPSTTNDTNDKDEIPLDEDGNPILPEGKYRPNHA